MINKKSIFLITMIGIFLYLLYVLIFYPYQNFKEYSTQDDNKVASDLMNNTDHIDFYEINSHYVNIRNVPGYKYAYENPLRFKNYYLDFIKKNKTDMKQLDLILKLSCQLPPKNQLDFYQKALDILSKNNVDKE